MARTSSAPSEPEEEPGSDASGLVYALVETKVGPDNINGAEMAAWWALDMVGALQSLEEEGWRFLPPKS